MLSSASRILVRVQLVLIRHGQPEWVRDGCAVVNPPLTELGQQQAHRLAASLADESFDEIYVSPLQRARQTAAPVLEALGRDEVIADWLEEIRDPDWHGFPAAHTAAAYDELHARHAVEQWRGLPGGEPFVDFAARIRAGALWFLSANGIELVDEDHGLPVWHIDAPQRHIAAVAHAGTNSLVIGVLLGLAPTPWEWHRLPTMHASVSRLDVTPIGPHFAFRLRQLSNVEHLPATHRTS